MYTAPRGKSNVYAPVNVGLRFLGSPIYVIIVVNMNKEEHNKYQRQYRLRTRNKCTRKYEKSVGGFLMRMYRNMQSRTCGIQWRKAHLYKGKSLLDRATFYAWAKSHPIFTQMFADWELSNYDRRLTPTVDRVDSAIGYQLDNMEWVTHSENSRRGSVSKQKGVRLTQVLS